MTDDTRGVAQTPSVNAGAFLSLALQIIDACAGDPKRADEAAHVIAAHFAANQAGVGSERTSPSDVDAMREALGDLIGTAEILLHAAETKYIRESTSFFKQYGMLPSLEAAQASVSRAKGAIAALHPDDGRRG